MRKESGWWDHGTPWYPGLPGSGTLALAPWHTPLDPLDPGQHPFGLAGFALPCGCGRRTIPLLALWEAGNRYLCCSVLLRAVCCVLRVRVRVRTTVLCTTYEYYCVPRYIPREVPIPTWAVTPAQYLPRYVQGDVE